MADYSYGQLEQLWISAGGSRALAPLMAAIALAESGGNPAANNTTDNNGTQTSWGLWQVSDGTHNWPGSADPNVPANNAKYAVAKYQSQGLTAWGTYDSGAYKKFYQGNVPPSSLPQGGGGKGGGGGTNQGQTAEETSFLSTAQGTISAAGGLAHDAAQTLNFLFEFFKPGQAYRALFAVGAIASGYGAVRLLARPGGQESGDVNLPLAILLTGTAGLAGYMALRPWPAGTSGRPVRAAAYVHDILGGHPPSAPPPSDDTDVIEAGLIAIIGIWAVSKTASAFGGLAGAGAGAGSVLGKIWSAISKSIGELGKAAGEVPVEVP